MRLRDQVIGALNLFSAGTGPLGPAELRIGQALADVATIGLLQERNVRRAETLAEQLQAALNSRVVIEQAKGRLAERLGLDMDQSFALLRDHARNTNQRLTDVARHVIDSPATTSRPRPPGNRTVATPPGEPRAWMKWFSWHCPAFSPPRSLPVAPPGRPPHVRLRR